MGEWVLAVLVGIVLPIAIAWLSVRGLGRLTGRSRRELPPAQRWRIRLLMLVAMLPALAVGLAIVTGHIAIALAVLVACTFGPPLIYIPLYIRRARRADATARARRAAGS